MVNNSININKMNKWPLNGVGNPGPGLWMPQKRGGVKSAVYSTDTPWQYIYRTV